MRQIIAIILILSASSCNKWSEEDKDAWKQACNENAVQWAATKEGAKTYCDCVLERMEKKYPDINDALAHTAEMATDTTYLNCRNGIKLK